MTRPMISDFVLNGTWKSKDTFGGMDADMVRLAPFANMPDDVKKMAEAHAERAAPVANDMQ